MDLKLLGNKNFRLYLFGNISSLFGDVMLDIALALYVLQITGSAAKFGATLALGMIPNLILGFFSGAIVDRLDKKKVIVFLDFFRGVFLIGLWWFYLQGGLTLPLIYITVVVFGVCDIFFAPSYITLLPSIVSKDELVRGNSINKTFTQSTNVAASVIAAWIFGIWGMGIILVVDAITFILSAISEIFLDFKRDIDSSDEKENRNILVEILDGFKVSFSSIKIGSLVINGAVTHLFLTPFMMVGIPFISKEILGVPDYYYGIINGFHIVGSIVAGILVALLSKKISSDRGINYGIIGMIFSAILFIPLGIESVLEYLAMNKEIVLVYFSLVNFCMFFSFGFYGIYFVSVYQSKIPNNYLGRFITMFITVISLTRLIGLKVMGDIFDKGNIMFAIGVLIFGMVIKLLIHIPYVKSKEDDKEIRIDI